MTGAGAVAQAAALRHTSGMMHDKTGVGVLGAGGRMGQAIIAALAEHPHLQLAGAIEQYQLHDPAAADAGNTEGSG